ncbi:sulfotransferase [Virgibacillus necropolis]|uniref:sulfotransferase family protein n=1 Tax=Virgibacillus necropolis TaxID=163877 RepID=UPI00384F1F46
MNNKQPNFFIVGAAKSATTSLYNYLKKHPQVYFSDPKEPRYLSYRYVNIPHGGPNGEMYDKSFIKTEENYYSLFKNVNNEKVIGEASVQYLYYTNVAESIKNEFPNSKIIICLRNPIDRAYSAYMHNIRSGYEKLSFEEALKNEEQRITENYPFLWHYKQVGLYYNQVKQYIQEFGKENVEIVLYDEIKNNTLETLIYICDFLQISKEFKFEDIGKVYNTSGVTKNKLLGYFIKQNKFKDIIKGPNTPKLLKNISYRFYHEILSRSLKKDEMKESERKYLLDYYKEDILKLEELIKVDLSAWRK